MIWCNAYPIRFVAFIVVDELIGFYVGYVRLLHYDALHVLAAVVEEEREREPEDEAGDARDEPAVGMPYLFDHSCL